MFIGVTEVNSEILDRIKTLAERLDIPLDAIMVEKTGYFVPDILNAENATITISEVKFSRTDKIRPLVGGIKIQTSEVCTLGFIAERNLTTPYFSQNLQEIQEILLSEGLLLIREDRGTAIPSSLKYYWKLQISECSTN